MIFLKILHPMTGEEIYWEHFGMMDTQEYRKNAADKTAFQMLTVIVLILNIPNKVFTILGTVLIYVSLALTVISLIDYIAKNKDVLKDQK